MNDINIVRNNSMIPHDIIEKYTSQLTDNKLIAKLYVSLLSSTNEVERTEIGVDFWAEVKLMPQETQQEILKAYMEATKKLPSIMEAFYQKISAEKIQLAAA